MRKRNNAEEEKARDVNVDIPVIERLCCDEMAWMERFRWLKLIQRTQTESNSIQCKQNATKNEIFALFSVLICLSFLPHNSCNECFPRLYHRIDCHYRNTLCGSTCTEWSVTVNFCEILLIRVRVFLLALERYRAR